MEMPEPKQEKEKKQPTAFDGSIFGRGGKTSGPPKFSSGGRSKAVNGGINTGDFPAMGDFPTIGQAEQKNAPAHQNKADMSGSYQSMAKDPNADPSVGSGISFSKGGPPMFTSSKKKNNDPTKRAEEAQGVQNYDFSKMNLATASKRHVEGEETQEVVQEDGTKIIVKKAPRQRQAESKDD